VGSLYLHDGLDVVLSNGTPIFAVADGTVRAEIGGNQYYRTLVIEDLNTPGLAWGYTHVYGFRVEPGDVVHQGTELAMINFQGLEHLHLDRLRLVTGGSWTEWDDLVHMQPDAFFHYTDTEAPLFEGNFRYVQDGTNGAFLPAAAEESVVLTGDVDIVVGIRDPGEWARSPHGWLNGDSYGDRNSPNRIEYEIRRDDTVVQEATSFDFSEFALMPLPWGQKHPQVLSLYQHYESVRPEAPPVGDWNRKFNYYIVTNSGGVRKDGLLDHDARGGAWRTGELDESGERLFPPGAYTVTVRAFDFMGNVATRSEVVVVN